MRQRASLRRLASVLLLAISVVWCACWFVHARGYWEDDAYIHLEYARSVAEGHGFAFNGLVVSGDTSPLWVLLLAAMHAILPDWLAAGKLLTVISALFGLAGIYFLARRIARALLPAGAAAIFPALLVLLVAVNPYTCYWLFSGMEPIAAAGLACWAVVTATRERPTAISFLFGCLFAGIAPLLRPEMLLLTALVAIPLLSQLQRLRPSPSIRPFILTAGLLLLTAPLAGWTLYSIHAFGHLLPSTVVAKRAGPDDSVLIRMVKVYAVGLPVLFAGFVVLPAYLLRNGPSSAAIRTASPFARIRQRLPLSAWIFLTWTALTIAFYFADHTYIQTRYVLLTAPGLLAIVLAALLALSPRLGRTAIAATVLWSTVLSIAVVRPFLRNKVISCRTYAAMALYIRNHVPPRAPVAVYAIGEIAFLSEHPIIDTGGITRPGALPYLNAPTDGALHWAREQGAQYTIAGTKSSPVRGAIPVFTVETPFVGWDLHPAQYSRFNPVSVWKLPSQPATPQSADTAALDQP